jgi:hypothetical protein
MSTNAQSSRDHFRWMVSVCVALVVGWAAAAVAAPADDLIAAAIRGDAATVQALLANGVEVDSEDDGGAAAPAD